MYRKQSADVHDLVNHWFGLYQGSTLDPQDVHTIMACFITRLINDIDRQIEHFEAPGIDYVPAAATSSLGMAAPVNLPQAVLTQTTVPALTVDSDTADAPTSRSRRNPDNKKRKIVDVDKSTCICGEMVTEDHKANSAAIECANTGCEIIWYHKECVKLDGRKRWICASCAGGKRRR
ncbi:hypothetical protein B0H19DRAFT_1062149 [Mycena capillaripes]|nr:hypothetical protein B0H19DRAFT_1062149 [Mycena capillaripes]